MAPRPSRHTTLPAVLSKSTLYCKAKTVAAKNPTHRPNSKGRNKFCAHHPQSFGNLPRTRPTPLRLSIQLRPKQSGPPTDDEELVPGRGLARRFWLYISDHHHHDYHQPAAVQWQLHHKQQQQHDGQ